MKSRPELLFILFLFSCIYDPPQPGREILIHNQTNKSILILDSLTGSLLNLYDTAIVNKRIYISRKPNYITDYGIYQKFYTDFELDSLKSSKNNRITLYIIDTLSLKNTLNQISDKRLFRSVVIDIDTLKKYDLNHLFITDDTILFEHDYNYYAKRKQ